MMPEEFSDANDAIPWDAEEFEVDTDDPLGEATARIEVSVGALTVEVEGDDLDETETVFERMWEETLADAEGMARAVRDGTRGFW